MKIVPLLRVGVSFALPPAIVLGVHLIRQIVLPLDTWMDTIAHFCGGAAIAWSAANIYRYLRAEKALPLLPVWFQWYLFVASAELVGVLWEFFEYIYFSSNPIFGITYADTVCDLLMDLLGAILLSALLVSFRNRKKTA